MAAIAIKRDWRKWKVDDRVIYTVDDFDGLTVERGVVQSVMLYETEPHLIVRLESGITVWVDDGFAYMFEKED